MKTALIAGATGLVGHQLLMQLLWDDRYHIVKALSRAPLAVKHPKLENLVVNFDRLAEYADQLKADDVFCCLGTTMKKARSKEAFEKVDYHYPVALGSIAREQGASQYLLVSAVGADKDSFIFYNRVKGRVEEGIVNLNFSVVHIFRPSFMPGPRREHRAGEKATKVVYKIFGFLIPKKYKAIASLKVARAMMRCAHLDQPGVHIHESAAIQDY